MQSYKNIILLFIGALLIPIVWIVVKYSFDIEDRFLPTPISVLNVISEIKPSVFFHSLFSILRLVIGFVSGIFFGVFFGVLLYRSKTNFLLLNPVFQSLRSIPPFATIPFFLLWFGFSEVGKYLIIVTGISFNLAIATYQILENTPLKYKTFFKSINSKPNLNIIKFALPYAFGELLPTIRFSLSMAVGLTVVAEMMGSQMGLGYLIQTAKSTFSLNVVFLAAIFWGIINYLIDTLIVTLWTKLTYWKN